MQNQRAQEEQYDPKLDGEGGGFIDSLVSDKRFTGLTTMDYAVLGALLGVVFYLLHRSTRPRNQDPGAPDASTRDPYDMNRTDDDVRGPGRDSASYRRGEQMWQHLSSKPRPQSPMPPPPPDGFQPSGIGAPKDAPVNEASPSHGFTSVTSDQAGFDVNELLRGAKIVYSRIHDSLATEDWEDVRLFTTPEFYDRLRHQAREKQPQPPQILYLEAGVLKADTRNGVSRALVAYKSLMQRGGKKQSEDVVETWEFVKDAAPDATWHINDMR